MLKVQKTRSCCLTTLLILLVIVGSRCLSVGARLTIGKSNTIKVFDDNSKEKQETDCSDVRGLNSSYQCSFVKDTGDCRYSTGFLQYNSFVYCQFRGNSSWGLVVLLLLLIYLFVALGITAEEFFCPCLKTFSKALHMSDSVAGVTLLALGNGAPDIFSVLAALTSEGQDTAPLAFQELFGAGIFVTTVVAGSIQLRNSFKLARRPFIRDLVFYLSAISWTFAVMYRKSIQTAEAIGFIVLYVIYVTLVIAGQAVNRSMRARRPSSISNDHIINPGNENIYKPSRFRKRRAWIEDLHASADFTDFDPNDRALVIGSQHHRYLPSAADNDSVAGENENQFQDTDDDDIPEEGVVERLTGFAYKEWKAKALFWKFFDIIKIPLEIVLNITNPVIDIDIKGYRWNKYLIMLQCFISPVACAFITEEAFTNVIKGIVVWQVLLMIGAVLALLVMLTTTALKPPRFHFIFAMAGFIVSVIWIYALAQEIVNLLKTLGISLGISNAVLGLTLLAWGNSIGDFISNMAMAKNGAPRMAIAACYGGPLLNMVLGVGISCTFSSLTHHGHVTLIHGHLQYILSTSFLGISLIAALVLMPILKFNTSKVVGVSLIIFYFVYLSVSLLNAFGILSKL